MAVFGESLLNGRQQLVGRFDFGGGHAAASCGGFDEEGIAECGIVDFVERGLRHVVEENGTGYIDDAEAFDHRVAVAFVKGEGGGVVAAGSVGDAEHVEVALQHAVFAGVAVDDDKGEIEAVDAGDGEVVAVDRDMLVVVGQAVPPLPVDDDFVDVVFLVVEGFVYLASALYGDVVFA